MTLVRGEWLIITAPWTPYLQFMNHCLESNQTKSYDSHLLIACIQRMYFVMTSSLLCLNPRVISSPRQVIVRNAWSLRIYTCLPDCSRYQASILRGCRWWCPRYAPAGLPPAQHPAAHCWPTAWGGNLCRLLTASRRYRPLGVSSFDATALSAIRRCCWQPQVVPRRDLMEPPLLSDGLTVPSPLWLALTD